MLHKTATPPNKDVVSFVLGLKDRFDEATGFHHAHRCVAASWPIAARAQQPDRMQRIGVLMGFAESDRDT